MSFTSVQSVTTRVYREPREGEIRTGRVFTAEGILWRVWRVPMEHGVIGTIALPLSMG